MRNPFNFDKNDAEFAEAAQTKKGRRKHITQLTIARSWSLVSSIMLALMLTLTPFFDDLNNVAMTGMAFAATIAGFVHLDLQIKFLKALEGVELLPSLASLEQTVSKDNA